MKASKIVGGTTGTIGAAGLSGGAAIASGMATVGVVVGGGICYGALKLFKK